MSGLVIRKVNIDDEKLLFDWANDPEVRKASFKTHVISWDEHCKWFESMIKNNCVVQYILEENGDPAGQIRYTIEDGTAEIGYSISPDHRGRGLATEMIRISLKELTLEREDVKTILARVKPENTASIRVFEKLGFLRSGDSFEIKV